MSFVGWIRRIPTRVALPSLHSTGIIVLGLSSLAAIHHTEKLEKRIDQLELSRTQHDEELAFMNRSNGHRDNQLSELRKGISALQDRVYHFDGPRK